MRSSRTRRTLGLNTSAPRLGMRFRVSPLLKYAPLRPLNQIDAEIKALASMTNMDKRALRWWAGRRLDRAVRRFNQNRWSSRRLFFVPSHVSFTDDPEFQAAYARAVRATGSDYGLPWRVHTILWAAQLAAGRPGVFVECGTGRGFMMSAVCHYLDWVDRPLYLFDTFKPTVPNDAGVQSEGQPVSPVYASGPESVARNFADWPGVRLVVGAIPSSLTQQRIDQVAFLHVDMNHPIPEEAAIRHFWPKVVSGGVAILDDYAEPHRDNQRKAFDRVAEELGFSILTTATGQGVVIRPP